jgi:CDP-diacylglycerol--glycerol-3-phosphate 3-phosphatidyltransferase
VANALSGARLLLAAALPYLLLRGGWPPLVAWVVASLSDYLDGPLARRRGTSSPRGAILDNVADVAFVLVGLATAAALGLVSWLVPVSIGLSAAAYALASARRRAGDGAPRLARSRLGHWAGIANYACLGVAAGAVAWPGPSWAPLLTAAGATTAGINLAAVAARVAAPRPS